MFPLLRIIHRLDGGQEKYKEEGQGEEREYRFSYKSSFEGDMQKVSLGTVGLAMKPVPMAQ